MRLHISAVPFLLGVVSAVSNSTAGCKSSSISWGLCNEDEVNGTLPMDCATLRVPLDYTDSSNKATILLDLARVPAVTQPSKGSIQFNFGGPGHTGRDTLASQAAVLRNLTGGEYDLIAFDPRGTGQTMPFLCVNTDVEAMTVLQGQAFANSTEDGDGRLWARGTIDTTQCLSTMNETGKYINTPFAARDLMSVVDALGEDGMLRYYGYSYGTTLGATVAAMFPSRIDRMILDGVQNPHEYYHSLANFEEWTDSDKVFAGIFSTCIEAGPNCTLAKYNLTGPELESRTWNLLEQVKSRPIAVPQIGLYIDYTLLKSLVQQAIYGPTDWPTLTATLDLLFRNQTAELAAIADSIAGSTTPPTALTSLKPLHALLGIQCSDRTARAASLDAFLPTIDRLYHLSAVMGDATIGAMSACAQWRIAPAERYPGDFVVATRNPVLFIGNTYDGHTPLASAHNLSATFEGSRVLEVGGYGHTSLGLPSRCTWTAVREYFNKGVLPEVGRVCEVEAKPYSNTTWGDVFGVEGVGSGSGVGKRALLGEDWRGWKM